MNVNNDKKILECFRGIYFYLQAFKIGNITTYMYRTRHVNSISYLQKKSQNIMIKY